MALPTVSVVIPCYQCGEFIAETIASIMQQQGEFELKEIIVVDDNRDDQNTAMVLAELAARPLLRVVPNHHRIGAAGARNAGIDAATGDWIAFLDSDDIWSADSLQQRFSAAHKFPEARYVALDFDYLHTDGSRGEAGFCRTREGPRATLSQAFETNNAIFLDHPLDDFLQSVPTCTCVAMVRRELLKEIGGFDESLHRAEDVHLWIRLAARAGFCFTPQIGMYYRQREGSLTHRDEPPADWEILAFKKLLHDPCCEQQKPRVRERIASYYRENYWYYRLSAKRLAAVRTALGVLRWQPWKWSNWKLLPGALIGQGGPE